MMNQNGHHTQKYRNNSSGGFTPRHNKPPAQNFRPNYSNNNRGPPKPGGNHNHHSNNNNSNPNNTNNHPNGNNNNPNNAPKTGSNTVPINPKDKSTINCYECGVVGHYSNECPKKLARIAANTAAPSQQQRCFASRKNQNNNNGRLYHMNAQKHRKHLRPCQDNTMPTTMDIIMPTPSLTLSGHSHHVYWSTLISLTPMVHAKDTGSVGIRQDVTCPDVVTTRELASARMGMATGAPAPPLTLVTPSSSRLPFFTHLTPSTSASPWTSPTPRRSTVAVVTDDNRPTRPPVHGDVADATVPHFQRQDARRVCRRPCRTLAVDANPP
ncbi:hypothetical protein QYE76_007659 [Lolium multiflorum]|uniref:CCHC-type domain-containing protein n=1 Tax=Lolium multiflorum TaxID=4521 RepID=A0AAD8QLI6_LOLMU|nr:hypothetical protein QYE76_007659 [Lolium multiflorum]